MLLSLAQPIERIPGVIATARTRMRVLLETLGLIKSAIRLLGYQVTGYQGIRISGLNNKPDNLIADLLHPDTQIS